MNIFTSMGMGMELIDGSSVVVCCRRYVESIEAFEGVHWFLSNMGKVESVCRANGAKSIDVFGGGRLVLVGRVEELRGRSVDVVFLGNGLDSEEWIGSAWAAVSGKNGNVVRE